jgi:hypothetical protein
MVGPKTFQKSVSNARFPTCFKAPNHFLKFLPTMILEENNEHKNSDYNFSAK